MREIKFRAWDKSKCIMRYGVDIKNSALGARACYGTPNSFLVFYSEQVQEELMQFVGLKDLNKQDIYESDIVKCGKSKGAPLAVVCFKQQSFLLKYLPLERYDNNQVYDYMDDYKYYTIIGNIYETKL